MKHLKSINDFLNESNPYKYFLKFQPYDCVVTKKSIKKSLSSGLILNENKIYSNRLLNQVMNKIGDTSDETLNKLVIFGLYRNSFGDIQDIKTKEELDKRFKKWYDNKIKELTKTMIFFDDEELSIKYLNAYIKNIKSLGDKARPFSLKSVKIDLVDLVNNKWIGDDLVKKDNDIYNPKYEDVVYEDENIIILNLSTKSKCIMYGQGESWCISKTERNSYNTYRIKYGGTPYFVLQKNVQGNEHKLIIIHYPNGYDIADISNSGDRNGSNYNTSKPWSWVESQIPNLKGMEKYFPYKKISDDELRYLDIVNKIGRYKRDNLQEYIDDLVKGVLINGNKVESIDLIRDYIETGVVISDKQIKSLRSETIDSLIESRYFLGNGRDQTNLLTKKQQLRNIRIKIQNNEKIDGDELILLPDNEQNEYISNLDLYGLKTLLEYSHDLEKIYNILLYNKEFISKLDSDHRHYLIQYSGKYRGVVINILNRLK